jgi:hypothetical protein
MASSSEKSSLAAPAVLITVLAALGVGAPLLRSPAPTPSADLSPEPRQSGHDSPYNHSAFNLILRFFDTSDEEFQVAKPWSRGAHSCSADSSECSDEDLGNGYEVEFIIATVPDPDSVPLRYKFDAYVDAIQRAANSADFSLYSFDLPWLATAKDESKAFRLGQELDFSLPKEWPGQASDKAGEPFLQIKPNDEKRSEHEPGIMLFRQRSQALFPKFKRRLLVVFIVGETPTGGINDAAFRSALDQIGWLSGWRSTPIYESQPPNWVLALTRKPARVAYVVGPSYSLSETYIRLTIERWRASFMRQMNSASNEPPRVVEVSGTAVGLSAPAIVTPDKLTKDAETQIYSVRLPYKDLWPRVISDLENGISNIEPERRKPTLVAQRDVPNIAVLYPDTSPPLPLQRKDNVVLLSYPAHVSDVRTAFGKIQTEPGSIGPTLGRKDLPMGDETVEQNPDVIPTFSSRGAMYDELMLASVFATLQREHIEYVGIVATDIEDLIFLTRQIRLWCADVVVFTTLSDRRFLHTDVNSDLNGMLVFSPYPIFNMNQLWSSSSSSFNKRINKIIQFPSDDAEGEYNATLKLLDASDPYPRAPEEDNLLDYGPPFSDTRLSTSPALWVSVVGHDAIWPLAFHDFNKNTAYQFEVNWVTYPVFFQVAGALLALLCVIPSLLLLTSQFKRIKSPIRWLLPRNPVWLHILIGPSEDLAEKDGGNIRNERNVYRATLLVALLLGYVIMLWFLLVPIYCGFRMSKWGFLITLNPMLSATILFALLGFLILSFATVKEVVGCVQYAFSDAKTPWVSHILCLAPLIGVVVLLFCGFSFIFSMTSGPPAIALLEFVRASNVWNGVSPLHPLMFAGIAGLCMVAGNLRRVNLLEEQRIPPGFLGFDDGTESFIGIAKYEREIIERLECPFFKLPLAFLIVALLVVAWLYFIVLREWSVKLIDNRKFYWLFSGIYFGVYLAFSVSLLRLGSIWWSMRRLLHRLYWHPTRGAYEVLRKKTIPDRPDAQNIVLFEARPSLTAVEGCLEFARTLLQCANSLGEKRRPISRNSLSERLSVANADLSDRVRLAELKLEVAIQCEAYGTPSEAILGRMDVQAVMAKLSKLVSSIFDPEWRALRQPLLLAPSRSEKELIELGNLFVAARVVDFLRQIAPQLWNLALFSMVGALAMMLAVSEYPFPFRDMLLWFSWLVLLSVSGVILLVFVQMNRDRILSMLEGTTPGKLNVNSSFLLNVLIFGVIPILTLAGAQFPHVFGGLFSWIDGLLVTGRK